MQKGHREEFDKPQGYHLNFLKSFGYYVENPIYKDY